MPFPPPLCFLQWNQSINNMHNFSTSIFNGAAKGFLSYRSHSVPVWCLLLWNSPQMQTVLRGLLVCVWVCVCLYLCVYVFAWRVFVFSIVILLQRVSFLFACLWVFPYITERGASEPSHRNDPHPQIAYSRSISGEGKIWGWIFNDENKWGNTGTQLGGSHGYVSSLDEQHDGLFTPGGGKALPQEMAH